MSVNYHREQRNRIHRISVARVVFYSFDFLEICTQVTYVLGSYDAKRRKSVTTGLNSTKKFLFIKRKSK